MYKTSDVFHYTPVGTHIVCIATKVSTHTHVCWGQVLKVICIIHYLHFHFLTYNISSHEMLGPGVETQKNQKKSCTTISKRQKQKISSSQDVGAFYSITGTRFLYYISLSTIWWVRGNGNLLVQIEPKNEREREREIVCADTALPNTTHPMSVCMSVYVCVCVCERESVCVWERERERETERERERERKCVCICVRVW